MYESGATCAYWDDHPVESLEFEGYESTKNSAKPKVISTPPVIDQMPHLTKMQKKLPDIKRKMPGEM